MRKIVNLLILIMVASVSSYAQYDMADTELNASLKTIIEKGKVHFSEFRSSVMGTYNVSGNKYDYMEMELGMHTGDIYLAVAIAKVTKKQLDDVIVSYKKNKKEGWGVIAKEMGVNPGSPSFQALKDDAYKKANGVSRPKPKPTTKKTAPKAKPKTKTTTKPATKAKTTQKPKTKK